VEFAANRLDVNLSHSTKGSSAMLILVKHHVKSSVFAMMMTLTLGTFCTRLHAGSHVCEEFWTLSPHHREVAIRHFALSEQLELYVVGMNREPAAIDLADPVASNGSEIVPLIMQKLAEAKSDAVKADLIYLLSIVSDNYYDLSRDQTLLSTVAEVANSITGQFWQRQAQQSIKDIKLGAQGS
jgi:hypothetical protein